MRSFRDSLSLTQCVRYHHETVTSKRTLRAFKKFFLLIDSSQHFFFPLVFWTDINIHLKSENPNQTQKIKNRYYTKHQFKKKRIFSKKNRNIWQNACRVIYCNCNINKQIRKERIERKDMGKTIYQLAGDWCARRIDNLSLLRKIRGYTWSHIVEKLFEKLNEWSHKELVCILYLLCCTVSE